MAESKPKKSISVTKKPDEKTETKKSWSYRRWLRKQNDKKDV